MYGIVPLSNLSAWFIQVYFPRKGLCAGTKNEMKVSYMYMYNQSDFKIERLDIHIF